MQDYAQHVQDWPGRSFFQKKSTYFFIHENHIIVRQFIFQKEIHLFFFHENLKIAPQIPYGGSILLVPFFKKSCTNGDFDFFLSGPQKFANF